MVRLPLCAGPIGALGSRLLHGGGQMSLGSYPDRVGSAPWERGEHWVGPDGRLDAGYQDFWQFVPIVSVTEDMECVGCDQ